MRAGKGKLRSRNSEEPRKMTKMKLLLVLEEEHRTYMEAMAAAIREFRPEIEVEAISADSEDLQEEVGRLEPQLVISSLPVPENSGNQRLAVIELSPDIGKPTTFRVGERQWQTTNPTLGDILSVVDETKGLFRASRDLGG
jgi:hypothetical protein